MTAQTSSMAGIEKFKSQMAQLNQYKQQQKYSRDSNNICQQQQQQQQSEMGI